MAIAACGPEQGGLVPTTGAASTGVGSGSSGGAGGSSGSAAGGSSAGGAAGNGSTTGGAGTAGTTGGSGGDSGTDAGVPEDGGTSVSCVFHTDPVVDAGTMLHAVVADDGGAGGAGGAPTDGALLDAAQDVVSSADAASGDAAPRDAASEGGGRSDAGAGDAGPAPSVTVLTNAFVGPYLADSVGRTLYTYGGDLAGDCNYPPISGCERDCLVAWPLFEAGPRTLAAGLDPRAFGTILRGDGAYQTTYYGWPLYYYKTDVAPGQFAGQAKAKTWHAATVIPVGIVILRDATTSTRYLADGGGRTLYVFSQDTKGTIATDPVSACTGTCLDEHPVFRRSRISVVSSLEITDFSTFVQGHARQQLAYKGAPLYYAAADMRSGDQKGATTAGWSVALP
jgi:predicted lipoprotein with Yx(FWY)xxD motif